MQKVLMFVMVLATIVGMVGCSVSKGTTVEKEKDPVIVDVAEEIDEPEDDYDLYEEEIEEPDDDFYEEEVEEPEIEEETIDIPDDTPSGEMRAEVKIKIDSWEDYVTMECEYKTKYADKSSIKVGTEVYNEYVAALKALNVMFGELKVSGIYSLDMGDLNEVEMEYYWEVVNRCNELRDATEAALEEGE